MRIAFPVPSWLTLPYIPDKTYATASPIAMRIPSNFCAPFLGGRNYVRKAIYTSYCCNEGKYTFSLTTIPYSA